MEVDFTPEQEAQLVHIATQAGANPERLVKDVLARYLDDEARFLAAVEKGIAAAERGEFIDQALMRLRWTPPAADDLEGIKNYLHKHHRSLRRADQGS